MNLKSSLNIDNLPFSVIKINHEGYIVECIKQVAQLTGFDNKELKGKAIDTLFPQFPLMYLGHQGLGTFELTLFNKSQNTIDCSITINESSIKGNESEFILFFSPQTITNFQYEPNELHDFSPAIKSIEDAFWKWDIENKTISCSSMVMSILGYSPETYKGSLSFWKKIIPLNIRIQIQSQLDDHIKSTSTSINLTQLIETRSGENKWIKLIGRVCEFKKGKPCKIFGSIKDVTDHYGILKKLQKQNNYLKLAEELENSGHWRLDLEAESLYWSKGVYDIHGVTSESYEPTVESAINFYILDERDKVKAHIETAINNKQSFYYKSIISQPFGKQIKVVVHGDVELNENGDVVGVFGVFKDIDQSEEAIEKLKLLAMVNNTITVPIFFIDDKDNVVYQDLSPQLGTGNSVLFNYVNFNVSEYLTLKEKAKAEGQIKRESISFDKYHSVFDLSVTYEKDEGIYIWIVNNVTETFRSEQQQIISNRLALLGNTFGNVSHDINNVLGVALGATEMLELKYSQGDFDISQYIERVKNAIDKGKSVTERLLTFTRKPNIKVVNFEPIKEIEDNKYLLKQLLLNTIELSFNLNNSFCEINFPQGEFVNILLNLVLNSQDAIKEKSLNGKIIISANITSENKLEIHVKDSGVGIEEKNISRIFDPFYSSKSKNIGNGIGLANVYSTIYKHNGQIQVEGFCELGGAHFTLIFDCTVLKEAAIESIEKVFHLNLSNKNILILDDEESIAEFVALSLENEGSCTVNVNNKKQLLDALEQPQSFDIFITDMILPDISGREAIGIVLEKYPNIKVCSMSGYIAEEKEDWNYPVLRKPFNAQELKGFLTVHV